jgi:predicted double-glycine peptidase
MVSSAKRWTPLLTSADRLRIARDITSADHDYFVWSGLLGEPFLRDGILCFFDGDTVAVAGHELGRRGGEIAAPRLTAVMRDWSIRADVAFINYSGPAQAAPLPREEWNLLYTAGPQPWNYEVFLDLRRPEPYGSEIRRHVRAAQRRGLRVTMEHREFLGFEHIHLLRELAIRHHFIASSASYLTNVVSILRSKATAVWEARIDGVLVGFDVTHEFFEHHPFSIIGAADRGHPGTSDAIHAAMIEHYRDRGACELGLGHSVDEGLYRWKTKWPGALVVPACHQSIWQRVGNRSRYSDCLYWPWRLITDAVAADLSTNDSGWLPSYHHHPVDAIRVPVPDIAHLMDSSSGLSALMAVCRYYGVGPEDEVELAAELSLDQRWPDPERVVVAAVRYGLSACTRCPMSSADLKEHLDRRRPVLILVQAWGQTEDEAPRVSYENIWEDDHYLVAIGYDRDGVYFEDPSLQGIRGYLSWEDLEQRWHARGPNGTELHRFGAALWMPLAGPAAYLSRACRIM